MGFKMIRTHKIRLYPNNKQVTYFKKACGVKRLAYNWGLAKWKEMYEHGEKPNANMIDKEFNKIKKEKFPFTKEVTKWATQLAIKEDLDSAFQRLYKKIGKYPRFKKKSVKDSFRVFPTAIRNGLNDVRVDGLKVKIPRLGFVRMAQLLRYSGTLKYCTISRKADKWFISISVEIPDTVKETSTNENQVVGVDLGVKNLATLSNGLVIEGRKVSREFGKRVRRLNRELSRRKGSKKGERKSNNFLKTQLKLSKFYLKMVNIRNDQIHKLTHYLTRNYPIIGIENLNVSGMLKNHRLAGSIQDMSFHEFRKQLDYKAKETGSKVVIANRFFPSSKTCNVCGGINKELRLSDRVWVCSDCGTEHDRDINAAINLRNMAVGVTVSALRSQDGGVEPSLGRNPVVWGSETCKSGEKDYA